MAVLLAILIPPALGVSGIRIDIHAEDVGGEDFLFLSGGEKAIGGEGLLLTAACRKLMGCIPCTVMVEQILVGAQQKAAASAGRGSGR